VKTTIEIPDDLLRRAKAAAAGDGLTLKELLTDALERRLRGRRGGGRPAWRKLSGGLGSLAAETRRIGARIDREFETIDEEDAG
jgi:hypothetical protein